MRMIRLVKRGLSFSGNERNCVFLNAGDSTFSNVAAVSGIDFPDDARAVGRVDWDADGDLDLWVSNRNAPQVRFLRNDLASSSDNRWIAFRLTGRKSNRDAIGARLELVSKPAVEPNLTRTLRAGDGYLTQSSKWITIGVGSDLRRCDVRVTWPSGWVSEYSDLPVSQRYQLVEGEAEARQVNSDRQVSLAQVPIAKVDSIAGLSVTSFVKPHMPSLDYLDSTGQRTSMESFRDSPVLLVLWASWCQPCVAELTELSVRKQEWEASGLKILALCVDRLSPKEGADAAVAREILQRLPFPYSFGEATAETSAKLQLVNDFLFGLHRPLPVPTSFLIDQNNRLAAIYRGPLSSARLKIDLQRLQDRPEQRRESSVPFAGRWAGEQRTLKTAALVLELIEAGFLNEASELVQRTQSLYSKSTILDLVVRLGVAHFKQGSKELATQHFRMARRIEPQTVGPEMMLGQWYEGRGEYEVACRYYVAAMKISPDNLPAMNNLAWLLATCPDDTIRDGEQALRLAKTAAEITQGRHPAALDTWAASLAENGEYDQASQVAQRAVELAKRQTHYNLAGQIEVRRRLYRQGSPYRSAATDVTQQ
ncbi:MAG: redoxin domain-containing protein [Planctomycetaceae bacterium]|nr:redoxin domain-containing protein [Planctomycetaceae bacterium]